MLTPYELETSLLCADAEFRIHYYHHWNFGAERDWHLEVRAECKAYGQKALELFTQGKTREAISELKNAHALEGDFCGWVDFRVYASPLNLLKEYEKNQTCQNV